jgi:hypothetical protein
MRRIAAAFRLLPIAVLLSHPAAAAPRFFLIDNDPNDPLRTAPVENACPVWIPESNHDDCSYNASDPSGLGTAQWIGPVFGAGYFAPGSAPPVFESTEPPAPVIAPAPEFPLGTTVGIPITQGFLIIEDRDTPLDGTDDVIGGTIEFGAFERNLAFERDTTIGVTNRAIESFDRIIHRLVPALVSLATPNAAGGFDYIIGALPDGTAAFPEFLSASNDPNDIFPSEIASQSSADPADVPYWSGAAANGIAPFEGDTGLLGTSTSATAWGYSCDSGSGPSSCSTTGLLGGSDAQTSYGNVLLKISTDNAGRVTAAKAVLVNLSNLSTTVDGTDSWQATTLSFTATETPAPLAVDDRAILESGAAPGITTNVLLNDAPGMSPVAVTIIDPQPPPAVGTAEVLTGSNQIRYTPAGPNPPSSEQVIHYRITDTNSVTDEAELHIEVQNFAPTAVTDDVTVENSVATNLGVVANDTHVSNAPIVLEVMSAPAHGNWYVIPAAGSRQPLIAYGPFVGYVGPDSLTYRLIDADGETSDPPVAVSITVRDSVPEIANDSRTVEDGVATNLPVLANDQSLVDPPFIISITAPPAHGTAVVVPASGTANPSVTYTSTAGFEGDDTFTYTVTDADGNVSATPATVTLHVHDTVPVAEDDSFDGSARSFVTFSVLSNINEAVSLVDRPITIEISQQPALGSARVASSANANGLPTIEYRSNNGSAGSDTLKYQLHDSDGDVSGDATVTFTITNETPQAVDDPQRTIENDTATVLDVLANDTGKANRLLTITITGQPAHGSVAVLAGTATSNPTVRYTPASGYEGPDSFRYTFRDADGDGSASDAAVPLMVSDSVPQAVDEMSGDTTLSCQGAPNQLGGSIASGSSREPVSIDVLCNDTGLVDLPVTMQITQQPSHGTAVPVTIDRFNGVSRTSWPGISYASDRGSTGDEIIKYTVTDSDGDVSNVGTLTLKVTNQTPVAEDDAGEDGTLLPAPLDVVVEGLKTPMNILANDKDIGNGPLTIKIVQKPAHGTATVESAEERQSTVPGISYQGTAGYVGPDSFSYTVTDADEDVSTVATVSFGIISLPVASNDGFPTPLRINLDKPITVNVLANDGGLAYGPITIQILDVLNGTAVVNADNTITFTPTTGFTGCFPSLNCPFGTAGGRVDYRIIDAYGQRSDALNLAQSQEGQVFIDVFPPPVIDSGGSSSIDMELLALLATGGILRRRFGRRAAQAPGAD